MRVTLLGLDDHNWATLLQSYDKTLRKLMDWASRKSGKYSRRYHQRGAPMVRDTSLGNRLTVTFA